MINKYLFSIINTFSKEDWNEYKSFIISYDAVSSRKYYPLVKILSKFGLNFENIKSIPPEKLFKKAYRKALNQHTIMNRQSELLNITKEFLENHSFKKNILSRKSFLHQELINRDLFGVYEKETVMTDKIINDNNENEDAFKYIQELILTSGAYYQKKQKQKAALNMYFQHSKYLLADILCGLFRTGQEFRMYKYSSVEFDFNPVLEFIDAVKADKYFEILEKKNDKIFVIPTIRYYVFKAIQDLDNAKYISKALQIFFENENRLTEYFRTEMYRMFMTYYNRKLNRGEQQYYNNLYHLYRRKLKNNLVSDLKNSSYPSNVFREYIITGLKLKKYKWVMGIINKYSSLLPEKIREDEINIAMIRLYFYRKEYEKAIELIKNHKSKNVLHHLDSMRYKLVCYYELKRFEETYFEVNRSKHYLKYNKNKIPEIHIAYYKKFLDKVLKLLNYYSNPFNKDSEMILFEIENDSSGYMMKDWINDKVREIVKNSR